MAACGTQKAIHGVEQGLCASQLARQSVWGSRTGQQVTWSTANSCQEAIKKRIRFVGRSSSHSCRDSSVAEQRLGLPKESCEAVGTGQRARAGGR
jgi:hypothetical protein